MAFRRDVPLPSQQGRVAIVTGGTGGLGLETAKVLAGAGAEVIVAGRNAGKGQQAVAEIRQKHPAAKVRFGLLDLASLDSIRSFATSIMSTHPALDLLINNAGVMAVPARHETRDGFELQFGTNYLGHFALTGLLLPALRRGKASRVVNLASLAHLRGRIDFADPQARRGYNAWKAYCQSKLAMLMFGLEFQRRSAALGWGVTGVSAHPGWAMTDIFKNGPTIGGGMGMKERLGLLLFPLFGQSAAAGAWPILFAATAPKIQAGGYYGPDGFYELKGRPKASRIAPQARNVDAAARLWDLSVDLTGVDPTRAI
ncbi:oxidoreductase [Lichenifustis flavocetrariae]|uniref:Oxidoreductase n=1 Tax=Lichenifustis flavocetrariae TaxID=2949735 RepID=A0AA41YVG6_9HYPH|nr:oxidoreductase [Lichenifustis flavocetrariae]MCW6509344.1 oxidoreductase [Lichenifustis flavocetrariae]